MESLNRKRRASPFLVKQEPNGTTNPSTSVSTNFDNTEEESAKKARIIAEATSAVNHVPGLAHRQAIDPAALALPTGSRGILVLPGSQQPGLRPQYILGSNPGLPTANGILPQVAAAQNLPQGVPQAPSAAVLQQLQANAAASVLSIPGQTPGQVAAAPIMTSAATTNFFANNAQPVGHQVINSAGKPVNMTYHTQKDTTFTKIFVGGLPYHTTDSSLRKYFENFGEIEEAVVITDRVSNCSKGYGFVTMADKAGAELACKDPNPVIDGRKANVNLAYIGAKPRGQQIAQTNVLARQGTTAYAQYVQPIHQTIGQSPYGVPAVYSYGPTAAAAAYVTPGGVLVPAAHAASFAQPTPIIDYGSQYAAQIASTSPFAQDVAASVGAGMAQYQTAAVQAAVQAPHPLAAATHNAGYTATFQTAGIPGGSYPAGYATVSSLQPPLATTPNPAAYAHITAQLQASDRLGLTNQ